VSKPSQIEAAGQILPRFIEEVNLTGVTYKIRRHPRFLRLKHIDHWIKSYEYTEKHPNTALPQDDVHICWLDLGEQYEAIKEGFEYERQKHYQKSS